MPSRDLFFPRGRQMTFSKGSPFKAIIDRRSSVLYCYFFCLLHNDSNTILVWILYSSNMVTRKCICFHRLLDLQQFGLISYWHRQYLWQPPEKKMSSEQGQLGLKDLVGVVYIFGICLACAMLVLLFDNIKYHFWQKKRDRFHQPNRRHLTHRHDYWSWRGSISYICHRRCKCHGARWPILRRNAVSVAYISIFVPNLMKSMIICSFKLWYLFCYKNELLISLDLQYNT